MRITLAAPTFDPSGHVALDAELSNAYQASRRGSVTATLDGGASVYDTGYALADQTVLATVRAPRVSDLKRLRYLIALYPELHLYTPQGAYVTRASFSSTGDAATINLRLLARLDG